jgi:CRP-like cAMP-binding protein
LPWDEDDEDMARGRGYRSTRDLIGAMRRLMRAAAERVANGETDGTGEEEFAFFVELEQDLHQAMAHAVERMRQNGVTDAEIAAMLGVSRQAVSKRWPGGGRRLGPAARFRRERS